MIFLNGSNICLLVVLLGRDRDAYYPRFILDGVNEQVRAQTTLQVIFELDTRTWVAWPAVSLLGFTHCDDEEKE